jgi:type I restriction enzyme S subunit
MSETKEIPYGWEVEKLGDFVFYQKGKKPKVVSSEQTSKCHLPYVNIKAFEKNIIDEFTDGAGCVLCEDDDFLMVWDGARSGYVGKAIKGSLGSTLVKISFPGIFINYAYYFLQSKFLKINTKAKGTGIPHVDPNLLWNYHFPIPPFPEQQRIVAKIEELFSSLDKGIESLKTAQAQLKTYRQAVLKWAFEGKLTNDNVKEGEFPEGWKWVKIDDVAENLDSLRKPINKTERLKRLGTIPYYGANGRTGWINDYLFDEPLILVVEDETFVGRELPFSYKITGKAWVNNHAHILRPKKSLHIDFLNYQLAYYPFLPLTTGTTGRKKLTKNALMNAPFKVCPLPEQHRIVSEIETRLSVCDKLEESITQSLVQAEALRQSILKKAFEGKLVPQDPNDEPASVLLERIRAERTRNTPEKRTRSKKGKK